MDYETSQKLVESIQLERLTPPFKITFFGIINYLETSNSSESHLSGSSNGLRKILKLIKLVCIMKKGNRIFFVNGFVSKRTLEIYENRGNE